MPLLMRYILGVPVAILVTLVLFDIMRRLVIPSSFELEDEANTVSISITRQLQESEQDFSRQQQQRPQQLDQPPPPPPAPRQTSRPNGSGVSGQLPDFGLGLGSGNFALSSDRDAQPLVRIPPRYPERAAARGASGWALVQFDVTPEGETINCQVIEAEPPGLWDRESCRAVQRWRYQPKIVDAEPAPRFGVQTLFTFELPED